MAAREEKSLKIVLAVIGAVFLLVAGGWFWVWRYSSQKKEEVLEARQTLASQKSRLDSIIQAIEEYEKGGAKDYYYRMLPNDGDDLLVPTTRLLADLEEEAGIYIISAKPGKDASKKKSPSAGLYAEKVFTIRILGDYLGLVRFVEGLEKEVDRAASEGGGRLLEVRAIKTVKKQQAEGEEEQGSFAFQLGWKQFDVDVVSFARPSGKK